MKTKVIDVTGEKIEVDNKITTRKSVLPVISLAIRKQVKLKIMKLLKCTTSPRVVSGNQ